MNIELLVIKEVRTHLRTLGIQIKPSRNSIMYDGSGEVSDTHVRIAKKFIFRNGYTK